MVHRRYMFLVIVCCLHYAGFGQVALQLSENEESILTRFRALADTDLAAARDYLSQSVPSHRSAPLLYELGVANLRLNDFRNALQMFSDTLELDPEFPGARGNRGLAYWRLNQYEDAVPDLLAAVEIDGINNNLMAMLGDCYNNLEQYPAAETAFRWALLHEPDRANFYLSLAVAVYHQSRYAEALAIAETAVRQGANASLPWTLAANSLIALGRYGEAIDKLEAARLLYPDLSPEHIWLLGETYLHEQMSAEAAAIFLELHDNDVISPRRQFACLDALIDLGDREHASRIANILQQKRPDDARTWRCVAELARLEGDIGKSLEFAQKAKDLEPVDGRIYLLLGRLYEKLGKQDDAISNFRFARSFPECQREALQGELEIWVQRRIIPEAHSVIKILKRKFPDPAWDGILNSINELGPVN